MIPSSRDIIMMFVLHSDNTIVCVDVLACHTKHKGKKHLNNSLPPFSLIRDFRKQNTPRKRFQNFRQSCMLSTDRIEIHQSQPASMTQRRSEGHSSGCDWWISIRSVDNTHD